MKAAKSIESLLNEEFRSVTKYFTPPSRKIWRRGFKWVANHECGFGIVSWEPFFIGLLTEPEAFAGRALDALINRKRLLNRLRRVRYDSERTYFSLDEIKEEINWYIEHSEKEVQDFWTQIFLLTREARTKLTPEQTLGFITESIDRTPRTDWESHGSRYLEHPGLLEDGGLLADALIGEATGSDLSFSAMLRGLLNQYQADISVAIVRRQGKFVVLPYSRLGEYSIGRMAVPILSGVEAQFANHVQLVEEAAFEEFEDLINSKSLSERTIQEFFELNPAFLCFGKYVSLKSHPVLTFTEDTRRIPDFFLERGEDGLSDILELKLPNSRITVGTDNRRFFSSAIYRGIAQLKEYHSYFNDSELRAEFERQTGLRLYRPNLILVIGRKDEFHSTNERKDLESGLESNISIMTFDDILESAKRRKLYVDRLVANRVPSKK